MSSWRQQSRNNHASITVHSNIGPWRDSAAQQKSDNLGASAAAAAADHAHAWAYSIVDSSRVSTFFISILLIVYGSFRSLALEEDKDGKKQSRYFLIKLEGLKCGQAVCPLCRGGYVSLT